jgi:hypothetical protein
MKVFLERCKLCGEKKEDHHEFREVSVKVPDSCKCWNDGTWDSIAFLSGMKSVCRSYLHSGFGTCDVCEHDEKCHEEVKKE